MNNQLRKLSEDRKQNKEDFRPISASIKHPNVYKFNNTKAGNKLEFPNLFASNKSTTDGSKKFPNTISEKERFYDENINLKTFINNLKKENSILKSEIHKLELEHIKKDKTLDDINNDIQTSMISGGKNEREVQMKIKETYLLNSLKRELKELQNVSKSKTIEIDNMKKTIKTVKINEINQEILNLNEELIKIKNMYDNSVKENLEKENYIKEYKQLQEYFAGQQNQLFNLSEEVKNKENNAKNISEEINNIKNFLKEKDNYIAKITKKLRIQKQINEKKTKEIKVVDINAIKAKINECENRIPELLSELSSYKKDSDGKDRKIKELEMQLKNAESKDNKQTQKHIKENIKLIQSNPEDNQDAMSLFLKSKLQEMASEKEKLLIINRNLTEKLSNIENNENNYIDSKQLKVKTEEIGINNNNVVVENNIKDKSDDIVIENKKLKEESVQNIKQDINEDDEEAKNYLFDEDQIKEFTYILIKNFEAQKLEANKLKKIFDEVDQESDEIVLNDLALKISDALNISNPMDQSKILIYINTLLVFYDSHYEMFKERFLSLFDSINKFTPQQEDEYKKKLIRKLTKHKDILNVSLKSYDNKNTGFITFLQLRKILDNIKINLKDELIEYLIFLMKSFKHEKNTSLEDLKYANVVSLIPEEEFKENSKITEESSIQEDEEEIHIKSEDFHRIFNGIIKKLADFLLTNKTNVKNFFKNIIYTHEISDSFSAEAIKLQFFLKELKKIDIFVDTIAMYCLFEKLKFSDEIESIDVKKLMEEVKIYGVSESNNKFDENPKIEEFFYRLGKFLKEKAQKLFEFLNGKIVMMEVEGTKKECISVMELTQLLISNNIINDMEMIRNIIKLFVTENNEFIVLEKFKSSLEFYYKKALKNKEKYEQKESAQKHFNIDDLDANDIPNADSKVFSDTIKSDKQVEMKKYEDEMDFIQELSQEDTSRKNSNKKAHSLKNIE